MKQIKTLGWLVMAAALTTTFAACSNDDNDTPDTPAAPAKSVTITVGAGITDDNATRSAITTGTDSNDKTTRTLTFTTGDKLYVKAYYGDNERDDSEGVDYYKYILCGILAMNGSPSADGLSASFTGDLVQYDRSGNSTDGYTYSKAESISVTYTDPLGDAAKDGSGNLLSFATLIHKDATEGNNDQADCDYVNKGWDLYYISWDKLATDVNTLMTKNLAVSSNSAGNGYSTSTKSFNLAEASDPIINCTINGLTASTEYTVTYVIGTGEDYEITLSPKVTTDSEGVAKFAFFGDVTTSTHKLTFSGSETKTATLSDNKTLTANKSVLNVTRTAN